MSDQEDQLDSVRRQRLRTLADQSKQKAAPNPLADESPSKRKKQIALLKDLLRSPPVIDFVRDPFDCNATPEEIAVRRRELTYRLKWLNALTEMTQAELSLLDQARPAGDEASEKPAEGAIPNDPKTTKAAS
jgi:hypothetical protein